MRFWASGSVPMSAPISLSAIARSASVMALPLMVAIVLSSAETVAAMGSRAAPASARARTFVRMRAVKTGLLVGMIVSD